MLNKNVNNSVCALLYNVYNFFNFSNLWKLYWTLHWTTAIPEYICKLFYFLPDTWQHNWATSALMEFTVETLSTASRWASLSLDLNLHLLKSIVEKSFSLRYVLPKRHINRLNTLDSSGKHGSNSLRNCAVLSAFPCASLNLVFALLHCKSISSICNKFGTLSTSAEKGSANSWKVSRCALKSAKRWSNSWSRFSTAEAYSSPLNAMPSSTRDLHVEPA